MGAGLESRQKALDRAKLERRDPPAAIHFRATVTRIVALRPWAVDSGISASSGETRSITGSSGAGCGAA